MTDAATQPDTVTITVDGREIAARPGEMIIAAAERAGVYIPRFCYHPRMRPVGMCRMCLVDVSGPRGFMLQPACFVPVADGQEVVTDSPAVKKAQDGVLEFLLINHPLDCPVCDKGGECPLQDQTLAYGPGETRFVEEKRHWEKPIALSSLVYLDRERCIQCDRCTRFADEVAGDPLIEFIGRGSKIEVNTFPDQPFASYFSGNTVQICPVGALTSSAYRFKARPWDLEQVESTCTTCAVGCRMAVQSSQDKLVRYLGIDSEPVNHGWLCDRGRFNFEAIASPDRLSQPLVRKTDEHVESTWFEALEAAAQGIVDAKNAGGGESIAVIGGARLANEDAYAWAKLAKAVIGTDSTDCQLGDGLPAETVLGLPRATIADACAGPVVITLAPDLKEALPVLYLRLRGAIVDGAVKLIELTPRTTGLSRYAAATLTYRPGEAAAAVAALLGDGPNGADGGVDADALAAARAIVTEHASPVVVAGRPSLAESAPSVAAAVELLAARLPAARFLPALRRGNVLGALDMGLAPGVLPGRVALDEGRDWYAAAWGSAPAARGRDCTQILEAAAEGEIHALVLLGADPLADFPDRDLARRALARTSFVVAVDAFLTESAKHANVVLPAAVFGERAGTTTNLEGRISRLGQKVTPPGVAWPDWIIASELATRLDGDLGFTSLEVIWDEIERLASSHAGITRAVLSARPNRDGVVAPLGTEPAARAFTVTGADVTAGLVDVNAPSPETEPVEGVTATEPSAEPGAPAAAAQGASDATATAGAGPQAAARAGDAAGDEAPAPDRPRPAMLPAPRHAQVPDLPRQDQYALRLITAPRLYDAAAFTIRSPSLAGLVPPVRAFANPHDLDRLGVTTGDRVRLNSRRVRMIVEVVGDHGVPRGTVALPHNLEGEGPGDMIEAATQVSDVEIETV